MHLLPMSRASLDDGEAAVDLAQPPGDMVVLSFSDSDLSALAAAHDAQRAALAAARDARKVAPAAAHGAQGAALPTLRLASLRRLRHPLSVDLYMEKTIARARVVVARCLGGLDYWRYGVESLAACCRAHRIALAVLPGDDRPDPRLAAHGTLAADEQGELAAYFQAGGPDNMAALLRRLARHCGVALDAPPPRPVPCLFRWTPGGGLLTDAAEPDAAAAGTPARALVLAYRSAILAGETAPLAALSEALAARGLAPEVVGLSSLKDPEAVAALARRLAARPPDIIVSTTAFSARQGADFVLDAADCPILQAIPVGGPRAGWAASGRGLAAADLAMQVALPEFDGRLAGFPLSFREEAEADPALAFARRTQVPDAAGIAALAEQAAGWVRLRRLPRGARRLAIVLPDYPARAGRAGFAVGLDTPESTCRILDLLAEAGYDTPRDFDGAALMACLTGAPAGLAVPLERYAAWLAGLPEALGMAVTARWGAPASDPACRDGAFRFAAARAGRALVALQPDRGRGGDRKAAYHDPDTVPTHAFLAFHLALRERVDALVPLGTHGTLEWLPGKAVALSPHCWPRLAVGALPVVYPFIVDDPGEAAPARRRLGAVALGHLTPQVGTAALHGEAAALRALVEEFSAARVLDPRRADLVAADILERAELSGLARACGVTRDTAMSDALSALDAHLCDLGETAMRTGLHVYGSAPPGYEDCAAGERAGLLKALDGGFVVPGPAGAPARMGRDVRPTGRNLSTLDPRALPTRAAARLGEKAAAEVLRRHFQDHGDWPRRVVMDLWASPTLRTGGEDIAHALALMGARPCWDDASTRLRGFEILPLARLDRPRVDVTVRISGAFRDTFPDQIALIDQVARAVAALDEAADWNPLAAARQRGEGLGRVYGAAFGRYGAGVAGTALDGAWEAGDALGAAYLSATGFAFGGREGTGAADAGFAARVAAAEAFVHTTDVAERDLLDGESVADSFGGFAAAARALGAAPALYSLDTSRPERPKARSLAEDIDRIVRARLTHPAWIAAQLAHGWRGGAELAQGVDALYVFAASSDAVPAALLDAVFNALVRDPETRQRLEAANPAAAQAIRARLADLRRRGLWNSRLNSAATLEEAAE
ncbi:cobaltochelatase subunit CobN [Xanthobacter sp. V4C-4]|uniref:cobaltochelatase subunit CobN n=1 Tax=Xanthobacter cornucopiae TaxID=3119924 RepID=UPI00372886BC